MFLLPALAAAAVSEIVYAVTETEKSKTQLQAPDSLRPHIPFRVVVDPQAHVSELPMTDKQIVVFGDKKNPGINTAIVGSSGNYVGWSSAVSQSQLSSSATKVESIPLVWQACSYAVKAALPGFTPDFVLNIGTDLCFRTLRALAYKSVPITQDAVVSGVKKLWNKMPKRNQSSLPQKAALKAAKSVAAAASKSNVQSLSHAFAGLGVSQPRAMMMPVSAPAASSAVVARGGHPKTKSTQRGIVVTHSEMVGTLVSHGTTLFYQARNYIVNPAKAEMFPWLSSMATNYDKYRIRKCVVHLVSMQPTSVAGRMGIAYDPDSTDDMPADRSEVYAMYRHAEGPIWQSLALELPVSKKELFCNTHTTADSKLIDDGQAIIFSDAVVATHSTLADVIVEYTVELLDPQQALFSTSYNYLSNISATAGAIFQPTTTQGPKYVTFFTTSSTAFYIVPSAGYYAITIVLYDSGAGSPVITVHNGTVNNMYGTKLNSTTVAIAHVICKVSNNSVNTGTQTFLGDYLSMTLSGVANLASLESIRVEVSRIAPPIYTQLTTTGLSTTAAGSDL